MVRRTSQFIEEPPFEMDYHKMDVKRPLSNLKDNPNCPSGAWKMYGYTKCGQGAQGIHLHGHHRQDTNISYSLIKENANRLISTSNTQHFISPGVAYRFHDTRQGSTPFSVKSKALAAYCNNLFLRPVS